MAEYRYEWEFTVKGCGSSEQDAWEDALNCLDFDITSPVLSKGRLLARELIDPAAYPDEPLDDTPVKQRPQDSYWLIWSNEHRQWWAPMEAGYTSKREMAGRYTFDRAIQICRTANYWQRQDAVPNETMLLDA